MISIGKRDRRITILTRSNSRGPSGDVIATYTPTMRPWAGVSGPSGRETMASGQNVAAWELKITVLFNERITRLDKIEYNKVRYDIVGMSEIGRREGLELLVTRDLKQ